MIGALATEADLQRFLQRELGRPGVIPPGQLSGVVITEKTIEGRVIVPETLEGDLLVEGTITGDKIMAETITAGNIESHTITAGQIAAHTITAEEIEAGSITATEIEAGSITADKLDVEKLSAISANLGEIEAGTVIGATIKTAASGARVEMDSLGIRGINASAVEKFHFDTTTGILTATAVLSSEDGSVIKTEHLDGKLTDEQIEAIAAAKITGTITETQIGKEAVTTPKIKAGAIETAQIAVGAVTAEKIEAETITGELIVGTTIDATKLNIKKLNAITADLGEITAGTLTGTTFRTSSSNPKVIMDSEGFRALNSGGTTVIDIPATGTPKFTGTVIAEGIELNETLTAEASNTIAWVKSGTTESKIVATRGSGGTDHTLSLYGAGTDSTCHLILLGSDKLAETESSLKVTLGNPAQTYTVIDHLGESSFLQLGNTGLSGKAKRKINFGAAEVEYAGGTEQAEKTINHGLGTTPAAVVITGESVGNGGGHATNNYTSTSFKAQIKTVDGTKPAAGTKVTVHWIAVG